MGIVLVGRTIAGRILEMLGVRTVQIMKLEDQCDAMYMDPSSRKEGSKFTLIRR